MLGALLVLGSVNYSIYAKEQIKRNGEVMYLDLAPVDPRSLMQGTTWHCASRSLQRSLASDGKGTPFRCNSIRAESPTCPNRDRPVPCPCATECATVTVWLGTNAYFFEEGSALRFAPARYGKFRVDPRSGEAVLVALCDAQLKEL